MQPTNIEQLVVKFNQDGDFETYKQLTYYAWGETPWSCQRYQDMIIDLLDHDFLFDLINYIAPYLKKKRPTALRIDKQEEVNYDWVSSIWVLIRYYKTHSNWHIITSFILNLFHDHQLVYKILACKLLRELNNVIDLKDTGLRSLFIDELYKCLSYLPSNLMSQDPYELLDISYQTLLSIVDNDDLIELLNRNLMSIDKVFNRFGESSTILNLQVNYLKLITTKLGINILISFNRVNFILNQMLINMYISEVIIKQILEIQYLILDLFTNEDSDGKALMYDYRFDLIGAWKIMQKSHAIDVTMNLQKLKSLSHHPLESELEI